MRGILSSAGLEEFFDPSSGFRSSTRLSDALLREMTGHRSATMTELYDHPELTQKLDFFDKHFRKYVELFWNAEEGTI